MRDNHSLTSEEAVDDVVSIVVSVTGVSSVSVGSVAGVSAAVVSSLGASDVVSKFVVSVAVDSVLLGWVVVVSSIFVASGIITGKVSTTSQFKYNPLFAKFLSSLGTLDVPHQVMISTGVSSSNCKVKTIPVCVGICAV